jgi:hypothetical protein
MKRLSASRFNAPPASRMWWPCSEGSCLLTIEAPLPDVTQHRGTRLVEVLGQVIHVLPRRRVEAGIHADAGAWLRGPMIRQLVHRCPFISMSSICKHLPSLVPTDYDGERSRLCKTRSVCHSW